MLFSVNRSRTFPLARDAPITIIARGVVVFPIAVMGSSSSVGMEILPRYSKTAATAETVPGLIIFLNCSFPPPVPPSRMIP